MNNDLSKFPETEEVGPDTAVEMIRNGAVLVDIREWEEVEMLAFGTATLMQLPQSVLAERFHEIPAYKPVVVGCRSGTRSLETTRYLKRQGFAHVYSLKGGINEWVARNFPVNWDPSIPERVLQDQ